tara:strand:- start:108 stop:617 length:510 start_codon:yes stop_codon:yes gene_type:complete
MPNKSSYSEILFYDTFNKPEEWQLITDNVMGGLSTGSLMYIRNGGNLIANLSGDVSTKNNGGFIQFRRNLQGINLNDLTSINIIARGNNEKYFVHIRTSKTFLPWQYYSIAFNVTNKFQEYNLPIGGFKKSSFLLPNKILPQNIKSIALVAYGKNYKANLFVKSIYFIK